MQLASRALAPELHDPLAALMLEMDGLRGAAAAATLPGITLATELRLRANLRHWQQAVEAADALMAGFVRRPPPGQFRSAVAAAAFGTFGGGGGGGYGGGGGGGGPALGDEFVDLSAVGGGKPANGKQGGALGRGEAAGRGPGAIDGGALKGGRPKPCVEAWCVLHHV